MAMTNKDAYLMAYAVLKDVLDYDARLLSPDENLAVTKAMTAIARLYAEETIKDVRSTDLECFGDKMVKRIHLYNEAAKKAVAADTEESGSGTNGQEKV